MLGAARKLPNIWAFALISQILPVSFAMNLSFVALILHVPSSGSKKGVPSTYHFVFLIAVFGTYLWLASFVQTLVDAGSFLTVVIIIRLLIFLPFIASSSGFTRHDSAQRRRSFNTYLSISLFVASLLVSLQATKGLRENDWDKFSVFSAVNDDPSTSALGIHYLLGVFSVFTWVWTTL